MDTFFSHGNSDPIIAVTKGHLSRLGYKVGAADDPVFDHVFESGLRQFQQDRGIVVDGVLGKESLDEIELARFRLGDRILKYDPSRPQVGDDVADLQKRLANLGLLTARINFRFEEATDSAVRSAQRQLGLNPDGIVGPKTIKALDDVHRDHAVGNLFNLTERARVKSLGPSLAGQVIVLESAASYRHFPTQEFTPEQAEFERRISDDIARRVDGRLTAMGAAVVHATDDDPRIADDLRASALISIAQDNSPSPLANGVATYYFGSTKTPSIFSPVGRELANLVSREIASRTPLLDCRSHAKSWESLRVLNTPKIYVLAGYASNEHDHALLEDADVRADLAEAIVAAVQRLFLTEQNDYDTGTLDLSNVPWASRS